MSMGDFILRAFAYVTLRESAGYSFYTLAMTSLTHRVLPIPGTPEMSNLRNFYIDFPNILAHSSFTLSKSK